MTDQGNKTRTRNHVSEKERFKFIGFDVFPKEPEDLFESDAERERLVSEVRSKRGHHDLIREGCTLMEERVSSSGRFVITLANVVIFLALFLPWYSAYNEIVEDTPSVETTQQSVQPGEEPVSDAALGTDVAETDNPAVAADQSEPTESGTTPEGEATSSEYTPITEEERRAQAGEEIITAISARKKVHKEHARLSGIGGIISLGTIGSYVFSSGISLMLTVLLYIIYTLLCVGLPAYTLYSFYGSKGDPDENALKFKQVLRLNWIPLAIFVFCLLLSFFGGEYGFDVAATFTSIGERYSPLAYLGTLSWGVFVSLCGFILCAAKGAEI